MAYYPRRYYPDFPPPPRRPDYPPYESDYPRRHPAYPPFEPDPVPEGEKKPRDYVVNKRYKYYGIALCLLSVASLAVEIANVVFTLQQFIFNNSSVNALAVPYILTWIAAGIWGSIPVFITGVLAIIVAGTYKKQVRVFALFCSLSAVVFTPAMIGISVAEIILYPLKVQSTYSGYACYSFNDTKTLSCPKFFLPLIVAILGGIEFYLTLMVTIIFCCCYSPGVGVDEPKAEAQPSDYPPGQLSYPPSSVYPEMVRSRQAPYYRSLPPNGDSQPQQSAGADPDTQIVLLPSRGVVAPDMSFLRSYPVSRPSTSRGFGIASAYNHGLSYGNLPGGTPAAPFSGYIPSLAAFGAPGPNPAYRIVYK